MREPQTITGYKFGARSSAVALPKVSVIMLNFNGISWLPGLITESIASVLRSDYPNLELVLVDNNSSDDSVSVLRELAANEGSRVKLVELDTNKGYAGGNNAGARNVSVEAEYLFFLNNDVVLGSSDSVSRLVEVLQSHPPVAAVQPLTLRVEPGSPYDGEPDTIGFLTTFGDTVSLDKSGSAPLIPICFPHGAAFMIRRNVFESLGGFNESFGSYFEDSDLGWRLLLMDYVVLCATTLPVYHHRSSTWRKFRRENVFRDLNQRYLISRNEFSAMFCNYQRANLVRYLLPKIGLSLVSLLGASMLLALGKRRSKIFSLLAYPMAVLALVWDFPTHYRDRRKVQKKRTVSDSKLFGTLLLSQWPRLPLTAFRVLKELGLASKVTFTQGYKLRRIQCRFE